LVEYYRYYRFFRDGALLSLLTTIEPEHAIPLLKVDQVGVVSTRDKGARVLRGTYSVGDGGQRITAIVSSGDNRKRIDFHSKLRLVSTYRGGWNKLVWQEYSSVQNEDQTAFSLDNFRPYLFSRVKRFIHEIE
jgi:hypothetical protein